MKFLVLGAINGVNKEVGYGGACQRTLTHMTELGSSKRIIVCLSSLSLSPIRQPGPLWPYAMLPQCARTRTS